MVDEEYIIINPNNDKIRTEYKSILSVLWYEYMCDDAEKKELIKTWKNNG